MEYNSFMRASKAKNTPKKDDEDLDNTMMAEINKNIKFFNNESDETSPKQEESMINPELMQPGGAANMSFSFAVETPIEMERL